MFLKNKLGNDKGVLALTPDQADMLFPVFTYPSLLGNAGRNVTTSKKKKKIMVIAIKLSRSHTSALLKQTLHVIF